MDQSIRLAVLQRDRFTCQACRKRTRGQVHHILPRGLGGSDSPNNLMTLCGRCHMLASPIPDLILCEVLRIRPQDLPSEKVKVAAAIRRCTVRKRDEQQTGVGKDMDIAQTVTIIEALADGVDPLTGEAFPEGSPYHQPAVIRALHTAVRELRQVHAGANSAGGALANAWKPWGTSEEEQLRQEFTAQLAIPEIARRHGRTRVAILGRLMRLGLLRHDGDSSAVEQGGTGHPTTAAARWPDRAGSPWTAQEDAELLRGFDGGGQALTNHRAWRVLASAPGICSACWGVRANDLA